MANSIFILLQVMVLFYAIYAVFQPANALRQAISTGIALGNYKRNLDISVLVEMRELYRVNYLEFLRRYQQAVLLVRIFGIAFIIISLGLIWFVTG